MSQHPRTPHRRRPADAWAAIREDYAAGVPARVAAERGGVSLSALRTRARQEGWRRRDGCGPPPPADWTPELEAGLESDPALLAEEAWLNAARCIRLGRLAEASAWARVAAHCRRTARDAEKDAGFPLAALTQMVNAVGKPMGRMHTAEGEKTLLLTLAKVVQAVDGLQRPPPPRPSAKAKPLNRLRFPPDCTFCTPLRRLARSSPGPPS